MKRNTSMYLLVSFLIVFIVVPFELSAQRKITFYASDGLEVTADFYIYDSGAPYIILLHQENSSRGEYREIAPKLQKMGFNCLAIDMRSGKESNYVQNETSALAQKKNISASLLDCEIDIRAAINYVEKNAVGKNLYILLGSSFSASLALKIANQNRNAAAVIAFSPGEYFTPISVKDWLKDFNRLVYVTSTKRGQPFVLELMNDIPAQYITVFQQQGEGVHGAQALWNNNPNANDLWMSLMIFINKVKEEKYK